MQSCVIMTAEGVFAVQCTILLYIYSVHECTEAGSVAACPGLACTLSDPYYLRLRTLLAIGNAVHVPSRSSGSLEEGFAKPSSVERLIESGLSGLEGSAAPVHFDPKSHAGNVPSFSQNASGLACIEH